jgi:hypothetical protein
VSLRGQAGDYILLGEPIGKGAFGTIHCARRQQARAGPRRACGGGGCVYSRDMGRGNSREGGGGGVASEVGLDCCARRGAEGAAGASGRAHAVRPPPSLPFPLSFTLLYPLFRPGTRCTRSRRSRWSGTRRTMRRTARCRFSPPHHHPPLRYESVKETLRQILATFERNVCA